jgi:hypothetical protein
VPPPRGEWDGPIGIAQKVARDFTEGVRSRGQSYFAKGRVIVTGAAPGEIAARVRGTTQYRVRLWMRGVRLLASCTCPYFGPTGAPCKHIWATVLAADARALLHSPPVRPLALVTIPPGKGPKGSKTPPPLINGQPMMGPGGPGVPGQKRPNNKPRPQDRDRAGLPLPAGRHKKARPGVPVPAAKPAKVAKRRLFYILDVPATLSQNQVVIDLARR